MPQGIKNYLSPVNPTRNSQPYRVTKYSSLCHVILKISDDNANIKRLSFYDCSIHKIRAILGNSTLLLVPLEKTRF